MCCTSLSACSKATHLQGCLNCRQALCELPYLWHTLVLAEVLHKLAHSLQQIGAPLVLIPPVGNLQPHVVQVYVDFHMGVMAAMRTTPAVQPCLQCLTTQPSLAIL